jgi:uncharacterized protein (TIRG00374 family)
MTGARTGARWRAHVGRWLGILVSLALLAWILRAFDLADVGRALLTANYLYLLPLIALVVINFTLRALRWGTLFREPGAPRWADLFVAMMIGYLGNNILPARAGELIRAYVLGKRSNSSKSKALATVMVERVVDVLVVLFLFPVLLSFYPATGWLVRAGMVVGAVGLAATAFLASLMIWGPRLLTWTLSRLAFLPAGVLARIEAVGYGFVAGVRGFREPRQVVSFLSYTAVIWPMEAVSVWLIAQAFSLPLSIGAALFIIIVIGIGMMVPSSPGYVGTYDFFALSALAVFDISGSSALGFTVIMHVVSFAGSSILGAICLAASGQSLIRMSRQPLRLAEE